MGFKVIQCTSCGGELQLDENKEFGFCSSCGAKIMLKETVEVRHTGAVSIDYNDKIKNTMEVADNSFKYGRYEEARKYYLKALEYDLDNPVALTRKDIAVAYQSDIDSCNRAEIISGYKMATRNLFNKMNQLEDGHEADYLELQSLLSTCTEDMISFAQAIKNQRVNLLVQCANGHFLDIDGAVEAFRMAIHSTMNIIDDILYAIPVSMTQHQNKVISIQRDLGNVILNTKLKYVTTYVIDKNGRQEPKFKSIKIKDMKEEYLAINTLFNRTTEIAAAQPDNKRRDNEFKGKIEEVNRFYASKIEECKKLSVLYKERKKEAPKCFYLFTISGIGVVLMGLIGLLVGGIGGWSIGVGILGVSIVFHVILKYLFDRNYMKKNHFELTNERKQAFSDKKDLKVKLENITKEYANFKKNL